MSTMVVGKGIKLFILQSMKARFDLELKGLKGRGRSMHSVVKEKWKFKGNRQKVYEQFCAVVQKAQEEVQPGDIQK